MSDIIYKIEQTLDVIVPFLVLIFSALELTGVINIVDKAVPLVYGALAMLQAVFKIWGLTLRAVKGAKECGRRCSL
jgi:hypothetical protein